jgi:hypothetical protein
VATTEADAVLAGACSNSVWVIAPGQASRWQEETAAERKSTAAAASRDEDRRMLTRDVFICKPGYKFVCLA